ncbi:MAG TPA: hypothetical protein VF491_04970 [Vicinamibacterales bacterium]|jgi:hypothetical protein
MKDHLDDAIDRVASRMTHVDDDPAFATRIEAALPERASGGPWQWLLPRLAITTAFGAAVALIVLRSFDDGSTDVLRSESARIPIVELARSIAAEVPSPLNDRRTFVEPLSNDRRTSVEPPSNDGRTDVDHGFSLPAIASVESLSLQSLAPEALPVDDALVVAPLAVADLTEDDPFSHVDKRSQ